MLLLLKVILAWKVLRNRKRLLSLPIPDIDISFALNYNSNYISKI